MKKRLIFHAKQLFKMCLQNIVLPTVYGFWQCVFFGREKTLIVCADSHHEDMPFSMAFMHKALVEKGYPVITDISNYAKLSALGSALRAIRFMKLYARARVVFICDSFLPVISCRKSKKTTVVQLMHSCGLGKKIGYDTTEDIPKGYRGFVYRNYDLVTVTSPACVGPIAGAMRHDHNVVRSIGSSRSDFYFDPQWREECRARFFAAYPQAAGKKIILWAPTFRGNAGDPRQVGLEQLQTLEAQLGDGYYLIKKVHPHVDTHYHLSNCSILTEELLPVVDLMITDYSSIVADFMLFDKPYVLFAPDLEEYTQTRGLYVDYPTLSPYLITDGAQLAEAVKTALRLPCQEWVRKNREFHISACDGHS